MTVDDLCWDLLALLICLRYQGPAKDPFLQTQWYMWYMWFLHIIAPVPVIALNALETPGEEAAGGVKIEWLAIVNLMWWVYCTNAMHTPQIYSDTGEELKSSWGGSNAIWKPLRREKKVDFAKLVSGHLFSEAPTSTQFVLFPCYASNKLTRYKFFET